MTDPNEIRVEGHEHRMLARIGLGIIAIIGIGVVGLLLFLQ